MGAVKERGMSVIGLVPARGGSKGIPRKNMRLFLGKPLFLWNTRALLDAEVETYVSTDDEEIRDAAVDAGANVFIRGHRTGKDEATTIEVVQEFVEKQDLDNDDILIVSQPTAPYLTAQDVTNLIYLWRRIDGYDAVMTVGNFHRYIWGENGCLNWCGQHKRRQDWEGTFIQNGCAYCMSVQKVREKPAPWYYNVYYYPQDYHFEIDCEADWAYGEKKLKGMIRDFSS